jgi:YesN/AraC family two-component response regulator
MEMGRGATEDIAIAEISNKVGIENPSYFSKQFHIITYFSRYKRKIMVELQITECTFL